MLRDALGILEETGSKGLAPTRFPRMLEVIDDLEDVEDEREADNQACARDTEMERMERAAMHAEEVLQRNAEACADVRAKVEADAAAEKAKWAEREAAEQAGMVERQEAAARKAIEDERKRKADAKRELDRRERKKKEAERREKRMAEVGACVCMGGGEWRGTLLGQAAHVAMCGCVWGGCLDMAQARRRGTQATVARGCS